MKLGPYLTSYTKKMGNRHKHKSRIIKVLGEKKTWINPHDPGWGNDSLDRIPKEQVIKENIDNLGSIHYQESERIAQGLGENMCRYLVRSLYLQKPKNFYNSMLLFSCSVTSDSLQPMDGSTSDFPVLHHLLSHVWLFTTPWNVAHQAPLSVGFSMREYWSGLPFFSPGDLPNPGIKPRSPELQVDSSLSELQGSPL